MILLVSGGLCGFGAFLIMRIAMTDHSNRAMVSFRRRLLARNGEDRRILEVTDETFVARLLAGTIGGLFLALMAVILIARLGVDIPPVLALTVALCGALLPGAVFFERIKKEAAGARRTFSYALSSYLDLASVLLAGGAGSETALTAAAATGRSWSFDLIRRALESARIERTPSWRAFGALGKEYGIVDLERLAGSMQLAGEQGAKVRISLAAQAEALRTRQIAEIEAEAQAATERMGVPTVLLFVGFIALLGYPALNLVIGQM